MTEQANRRRALQRLVTRLGFAALLSTVVPARAEAPSRAEAALVKTRFSLLWPKSDEVTFSPTTLEERVAFQRLIPALLRAAPTTEKPPAGEVELAASVGFVLEIWRLGGETLWVLREAADQRRGAGAYVIRTGPASEVVLQAPHAYFDLGTGELGATLFLAAPSGHRPRAFATNTAHRFRSRPDEKREDRDHPADLAHNSEHLFTFVTDLMARAMPSLRVIQLHGFGKAERPERQGIGAVLSTGTHRTPSWIRTVADKLGADARLFPEQIQLLGGTQNAQAKLLLGYPEARFLHVELSPELREALSVPSKLERFCDALFVPVEESPK